LAGATFVAQAEHRFRKGNEQVTIEIKHRHTGAVLFTAQVEAVREALEAAVKSGANLSRANLSRANLSGANLSGADLYGANLSGANLSGADLSGADLSRADLYGADLSGANLSRADLYGADLYGADLSRANLSGANLSRADLSRANLYGANGVGSWMATIRDDIRSILDAAPAEVSGLLAAMWAGTVDGSTYQGECACLVGTIAKVRGVRYDALGILKPDSSRPAERWFLGIRKGDTPVTNTSAAYAAAVIAQWQHDRATAKPKKRSRSTDTPRATEDGS
jgi:hypothetical protein